MPLKPKITEQEVDQMVIDYQQGNLLIKDLVKKYGRKATTIRTKFRERGIKIEYNRNRKIDETKKQQVLQLYRSGKTVREIACQLDISNGSVGNFINKNGISRSSITNPWHKEDFQKLELLLQNKSTPISHIAGQLNRSYDAIVDKICKVFPKYKRDHQALGIRNVINNITYKSLAEGNIATVLYENFISFEYEKPVCQHRKWTCDFYLPDQDLWVEYDGLEENRKSKEKFAEKIQYYKDNNFNYIILTRKDNILESLNLKINHRFKFDIKQLEKKICDEFLERVHYLKKASRSDKYRLGFYHNDLLVGVVTFGRVANPKENNICLNRCATIDRIRLPHPNNNVTSYIVSRSLKWLKQQAYKGKVISWSDPRYHNGTLYKACNFTLVDNKMRYDYIYVDCNGDEYHKSKCRVPAGKSELIYAQSLGLKKVEIPPKQRWEYIIK